jgi:hypothetical protein
VKATGLLELQAQRKAAPSFANFSRRDLVRRSCCAPSAMSAPRTLQ